MIWASIFLLAGSLAAQHSRVPPGSELCKLILFAALACCAHRKSRPVGLLLIGYGLLLQAGQGIMDARLDARYAGDSLLTQVRIVDFPKRTGDTIAMIVEPLTDHRLPLRSRVSWLQPPVMPAIGEVWELELRLRRPRGASNPGVFDREAWLFRERLHAAGYVVGGKRNRLLWSGTAAPLDRFRAGFIDSAAAAAESPDAAAVLAAIGVGARHLVSREQWDRYAITGTSHLMAISGLHIGLAASACFLLVFGAAGLLPGSINHHVVALLAGVVVAALYALVSGFAVPAQRAVLMLAIAALALARRRQPDVATTVALAVILVFVIDPVAALTPGYSLSFAAVILLLWLAHRRGAVRRNVIGLVIMQVFLAIGLLPLTAWWFQRFAIVGVPVNLLAVPLFSVVTVPLTLVGLVVNSVAPALAEYPLRWAARSIEWLEWLLGVASGLPFADMRLANFTGPAILLLLIPLVWVLLPPGWPGRRVGLLGVLAVLLWKPVPPPESCFDASILDVGQGLAVVLQTHSEVWMYDTGMAYPSGSSAADLVIVPFLKSRRIARIDRLIVSHADLDHSGGVAALRDALDVGEIVIGEPVRGVSGTPCHTGRIWRVDGVRFRVLHPQAVTATGGNDSSCVVRVEAGAYSLLLTGDIEGAAERQLLGGRHRLSADIVTVPHHGSLTSSSTAFVAAVEPRMAIISAGYANRWGFPKERVTERWASTGADVVNTASAGAIDLRVCADGGIVRAQSHREQRRRFWHDET